MILIKMYKKLCDYGCGQEAKYKMTSENWCCEDHYNKCPAQKKKKSKILKDSGVLKGRTPWNKGKTGIYSQETRKQK